MSAPTTLTPEQKLRRTIKFTLDRNPQAGAPESIAVLIEVTACVLNVMRKALVALGAPESVLAAHDDGDGDPVEQWIEAQPRRVPLAEGQQDTSRQDAEDYRKEQEEHCQKLAALHAALRAHHAWHLENEEHDAYSDSGLCEETLSALNVNPDPGWLSPAESAKLREEHDAAHGGRGVALIARERARQVAKEGWTASHDDGHAHREMAKAAVCYVDHYCERAWVITNELGVPGLPKNGSVAAYQEEAPPDNWPWADEWWKPNTPIRDLTRAGALIAAEIDRLSRIEGKGGAQ